MALYIERDKVKLKVKYTDFVKVGETLVIYGNGIDYYCVRRDYDNTVSWIIYEVDKMSSKINKYYPSGENAIDCYFTPINEILDTEKTVKMVKQLDGEYQRKSLSCQFWNNYDCLRHTQSW